MKEILRSHSLSHIQSLQIALEAEGIQTAVFDLQTAWYLGFAARARLMIQNDGDYERASRIIREIDAAAPDWRAETAGWRLQRWGCAATALGSFLLTLGAGAIAGLEEGAAPAAAAFGLLGVAVILSVVGIGLIFFGPRWSQRTQGDRQDRE